MKLYIKTPIAILIGTILTLGTAFGGALEEKAKATVVPKFEVRDASVHEVLKSFTEETGINVIYAVPPDDKRTISLSLRNIPASELIKYIGQLAKLKFTYEEDGVHALGD